MIIVVNTRRKRKKTRRPSRRRGRRGAFAVLSREGNVLVVLAANSLMMSK